MCPKCGAALIALELEGVEIDYCPECRGLWLDYGELAMIADLAGASDGGMSRTLYESEALGDGEGECPRCGKGLERTSAPGEIKLDRCPHGHGLWFDRGELRRTIEGLAKGHEAETEAVARFFADMFRYEMQEEETSE